MTLFWRKSRIFFLILKELSRKYTRASLLGLFLGLFTTLGLSRLLIYFDLPHLAKTERIGVIGEYNPSNLPLNIQGLISRGLTKLDQEGIPQPDLAQSWEVTDSGKTYLFHLNDDFRWHDKSPVLAKDINYNIRNVQFEVVDQKTLKAKLESAYSPFLVVVSKPVLLKKLTGSGPYKVMAISLKGDKIKYLKLIALDSKTRSKEFRFYSTDQQAIDAFKLGEIDQIENLVNLQDLASWKNLKIETSTNFNRILTIFINLNNDNLKNKTLRQILAYTLPKFTENLTYSPISKNSWSYFEQVKDYHSITESQIQKIIKESKIDLPKIKIVLSTQPLYLYLANKIIKSWSEYGINAELKVENFLPDDYEVFLSALDLPPDPDQYQFWHSTQNQTNITNYSNVKIDKLLEDGRQELDYANRKKIYADFQRRLVDDAPAIFLYYPEYFIVKR